MGAVVDVEAAERATAEAGDWSRRGGDPARWPGLDAEAAGITVDCAVCGRTHSPGTDDDPGCRG